MSDDTLLTRAYQISTGMTNNPNFTTPIPSVVDVQTIVNEFFQAVNSCGDGDRVKIAIKNQKRQVLIDTLHSWALYVLLTSNNDVAVALSSNFDVAKTPAPAPPLEKPVAPALQGGLNPGEIVSKSPRLTGAVSYLHQYATEVAMAANNWQSIPYSKSTCVIAGLTPATKYYFRLAVVGRKGQLVYSDIVSRVAA